MRWDREGLGFCMWVISGRRKEDWISTTGFAVFLLEPRWKLWIHVCFKQSLWLGRNLYEDFSVKDEWWENCSRCARWRAFFCWHESVELTYCWNIWFWAGPLLMEKSKVDECYWRWWQFHWVTLGFSRRQKQKSPINRKTWANLELEPWGTIPVVKISSWFSLLDPVLLHQQPHNGCVESFTEKSCDEK